MPVYEVSLDEMPGRCIKGDSAYTRMAEWAEITERLKKGLQERKGLTIELSKESKQLVRSKSPAQQFAAHLRRWLKTTTHPVIAYARSGKVFIVPQDNASSAKKDLLLRRISVRRAQIKNRKTRRVFRPRRCVICGREFIPIGAHQKKCKRADCETHRTAPVSLPPVRLEPIKRSGRRFEPDQHHPDRPPLHTKLPEGSEHSKGLSLSTLRGRPPMMVLGVYAREHAGLVQVDQALPMLEASGAFQAPVRENVIALLESSGKFRRTAHSKPTWELIR